MNPENSISLLILLLIQHHRKMRAFAILALYIAVANCARLPVDGVHQVVHSDHGGTIPPNVAGVHEQGPVVTGQEFTHDQGHYVHEHDYGHQNLYHVHPDRPQYISTDQYYHRPASTYNQVPIPQGPKPVDHGHVSIEHDHVKPIAIIQQDMEVNPDGSFHNVWESENGIKVQEEGTVRVIDRSTSAQTVHGQVSWTDYDGNQFHLKYVADEFGFHPVGDHLPTPPPIPLGIARGLEWIAAHPPPKESEYDNEKHIHVEDN